MNFWIEQPLRDTMSIALLALWAIALLLLRTTPGLIGSTINRYQHIHSLPLSRYISRFFPYPVFYTLTELLLSLVGATYTVAIALYSGTIDWSISPQEGATICWPVYAIFLGGQVLRLLTFEVWAHLFFVPSPKYTLREDYLVLDFITALLLLIFLTLSLSTQQVTPEICLYILGGVWIIFRLVSSTLFLHRSLGLYSGGIPLFLYLCAHELLTPCYILAGVAYVLGINY